LVAGWLVGGAKPYHFNIQVRPCMAAQSWLVLPWLLQGGFPRMRALTPAVSLILLVLAATGFAAAQSGQPSEQSDKPAGQPREPTDDQPDVQQPASPQPATDAVRRDPRGTKGISPFFEEVARGDAAYVARDFASAIEAYTSALTKEPQNPLGHYRLGEAHRAQGDLKQAEQAWRAALRFAGSQPTLKAKVLLCLADLRERQQDLQAAKSGWTTYEAHLKAEPKAGGYPKTPVERKRRADIWVERQQQYAAVKQRIAKRLEEVEKNRREGAKRK
jgi:tetratricopeptide (TPR) repeat protein